MTPRTVHRLRPVALAASTALAVVALTGCGSSGGDDATPTTTAPAEETTAPAPTDTTEADAAIDATGAADVAELTGALLDDVRTTLDEITVGASPANIQATTRTIRNLAFDADAELREIEVVDDALQGTVDDLLVAISEAIATFDEITTVDPSTLDQDDGADLIGAELGLLDAAVAAQEAGALLEAGIAVPDGPTPGEVLPVVEDFPIVSGVRDPAYSIRPEGTLSTTQSGACDQPSPTIAVPPATYASVSVEDPAVVGAARVLVFTDEEQAAEYVDASAATFDCDDPQAVESASVDLEDGERSDVVFVSDGITTAVLTQRVGTRVLVAVRTGDQISDASDAEAITTEQAEGLIEVMQEKAAG